MIIHSNSTLLCVIIVVIFVGTNYEENEKEDEKMKQKGHDIQELDVYNEMQKIVEKNRIKYDKFNQNNRKEDNIIGISKPIPIPYMKKTAN